MIGYAKALERLFFSAAFFSALVTVFIFGFMLFYGLPLFSGGLFIDIITSPWKPHLGLFGIYPMLVGTLTISLLGMVFAFPLSMGCAILIKVVGQGMFSRVLRRVVEIITGMPTVVYGFVGIFLLVPSMREIFDSGSGMCVLSASLMLAVLVSPTMILLFCDSFERVPQSYGNAVLAVGGTRIQRFLHVTLPCAWQGIVIGVTLSLGRAIGDTLIALMLAGNAVQVPGSVLDSVRTLTSHIALVFAADNDSMEFKAIYACGMSLYLFITLLMLVIRSATWGRGQLDQGR
ncbi:MAG: ABC transporter permease subunit [Pseudomonadota bacterium]